MRYHPHHHLHIAEHKILFTAWLLIVAAIIGWFLMSSRPSDANLIRAQGRYTLQDIALHDPDSICNKFSPGLIRNIQSMNFTDLPEVPIQLPEQAFCVQAAKSVFDLYGDYYVDSSSIINMTKAKVIVHGNKATLYFNDGEYQNTSQWVKQGGRWVIDDGILGLIKNVARQQTPTTGKQINTGYTP